MWFRSKLLCSRPTLDRTSRIAEKLIISIINLWLYFGLKLKISSAREMPLTLRSSSPFGSLGLHSCRPQIGPCQSDWPSLKKHQSEKRERDRVSQIFRPQNSFQMSASLKRRQLFYIGRLVFEF